MCHIHPPSLWKHTRILLRQEDYQVENFELLLGDPNNWTSLDGISQEVLPRHGEYRGFHFHPCFAQMEGPCLLELHHIHLCITYKRTNWLKPVKTTQFGLILFPTVQARCKYITSWLLPSTFFPPLIQHYELLHVRQGEIRRIVG